MKQCRGYYRHSRLMRTRGSRDSNGPANFRPFFPNSHCEDIVLEKWKNNSYPREVPLLNLWSDVVESDLKREMSSSQRKGP